MTMPHERTRALRWGHEVLPEICGDSSVLGSVKARAAELMGAYPGPDVVLQWIHEEVACIPVEAAVAIEEAVNLFHSIWRSENCPAQLREALTFTLRHFPQAGEARRWARGSCKLTIRGWILPEDTYD